MLLSDTFLFFWYGNGKKPNIKIPSVPVPGNGLVNVELLPINIAVVVGCAGGCGCRADGKVYIPSDQTQKNEYIKQKVLSGSTC